MYKVLLEREEVQALGGQEEQREVLEYLENPEYLDSKAIVASPEPKVHPVLSDQRELLDQWAPEDLQVHLVSQEKLDQMESLDSRVILVFKVPRVRPDHKVPWVKKVEGEMMELKVPKEDRVREERRAVKARLERMVKRAHLVTLAEMAGTEKMDHVV